jgi:hypothetical protein
VAEKPAARALVDHEVTKREGGVIPVRAEIDYAGRIVKLLEKHGHPASD